MKLKIGILGTRGIPNHHGGFEQFAEFFSVFAQEQGHEVIVYNSHNHPYQKNNFNGVKIIHCYDPESIIGTAGQFIYDFNCIKSARQQRFDILLQLGYTSSSIWGWFLPKNSIIITNMDGLEWKRSKFSKKTQKFLKLAEKWAIKTSDFWVADSIGIQEYLKKEYNVESKFIAYGSAIFEQPSISKIEKYNVTANNYFLLIARMEPENNIEMILDGYIESKSNLPFLVVGNTESTPFGRYLVNKFKENSGIIFLGGIYNLDQLNQLRYFSNLYFHGHSVGGTNPSLLEAMGARALIVAHQNIFNESVLGGDAFYFKNKEQVAKHINTINRSHYTTWLNNNLEKIRNTYNWELISESYLNYFIDCFSKKN